MAISHVNSTTNFSNVNTAGATGSVPPGTASNDFLLWVVRNQNASSVWSSLIAANPNTGWQLMQETTQTGLCVCVLYRYATASEPSSYSISTPSGKQSQSMTALRGVHLTTPLDAALQGGSTNTGNPTFNSGTSATADAVILGISGSSRSNGNPIDVTATNANGGIIAEANTTATSGTNVGGAVVLHQMPSTGSFTPTVTMNATMTRSSAQTIVLKPAAEAPPPTPGAVAHMWPGAPTSSGFKVVSKLVNGTSSRLAVSTSAGMTSPTYFGPAAPDGEGRVTHTVTGLSQNTRYYFQLSDTPTGGSESLIGSVATIRTLATAGTVVASRKLVFGGCLRSGSTVTDAVENAAAWGADYGIFNGDMTYAGTTSTSTADHRAMWDTQFTQVPALKTLAQAGGAAWYAVSDHDASSIDNDDSNNAWTAANLLAYADVVPYTRSFTTARDQTWDDGRISFFLIDVRNTDRSTGSTADSSSKTFLGASQKARLLDWIANNPARYKIIIGDTAWMGPSVNSGKTDWWLSYDTERQEVITAIQAHPETQFEYWHGDYHTLAYATPQDNDYGGFPVLASAPYEQLGGGGYPELWTAYFNNGGTDARQYARITFTDDGTTITRTFEGWDDVSNSVVLTNVQTFDTSASTPEGSASGTFTFAGSAVGKETPKGAAAGTWTLAGSAVGSTPSVEMSEGSASGVFQFSGIASGEKNTTGSASGSFAFSGAASGKKTPEGSASGTFTFAGSAIGKETPKGSATGSFAFTGNSVGDVPDNSGLATGSFSFTGEAAGENQPQASAAGTTTFVGSAIGDVPPNQGTATGSFSFSGTADALRMSKGSSSGSFAFAGTASGEKSSEGSASGNVNWFGVSSATTLASGSASGSLNWSTSAAGVTDFSGSSESTTAWVGSAQGVTEHRGNATSGSLQWSGAASGKRNPKASATGTFPWSGAAVGKETPKGSATGTISWHGSGSAAVPAEGSAAGTTSWSTTANGSAQAQGVASGGLAWAGAGAGARAPEADASGEVSWSGVAVGFAIEDSNGNAFGYVAWAASATGITDREGSAAGATGWAGSAASQTDPFEGEASGQAGWSGTAAGKKTPKGSAAGNLSWSSSSSGEAVPSGSASGTVSWTTSQVSGFKIPKGTASRGTMWVATAQGYRLPLGTASGLNDLMGAAVGEKFANGSTGGTNDWEGSAVGSASGVVGMLSVWRFGELVPVVAVSFWTGEEEIDLITIGDSS